MAPPESSIDIAPSTSIRLRTSSSGPHSLAICTSKWYSGRGLAGLILAPGPVPADHPAAGAVRAGLGSFRERREHRRLAHRSPLGARLVERFPVPVGLHSVVTLIFTQLDSSGVAPFGCHLIFAITVPSGPTMYSTPFDLERIENRPVALGPGHAPGS